MNALQIALLAGAGWLAWRYWQGTGSTDDGNDVANGAASGGTAAPGPTAPALPTTMALMQAEADRRGGWGPTANPHQWNWLYNVVRGRVPPDPNPAWPAEPRPLTNLVTMQEWWSAMQPLGVSGLPDGYRRM